MFWIEGMVVWGRSRNLKSSYERGYDLDSTSHGPILLGYAQPHVAELVS